MAATLVRDGERLREATVLIVEDHALLADGLADALRRSGVVAEVATSRSLGDIVEQARQVRADVVLLDLHLGDDVGVSTPAIGALRDAGATVLVLTGVTDPEQLGAALEAGASDIVSKAESFDTVLDKAVRAAAGTHTMNPVRRDAIMAGLRERRRAERARREPFERLTAREQQVLAALIEGASAEGVATSSFVSIATVRSQIRSILEKLGVHSQVAAVALAHRCGWSPDPD